MGIIDGKALGSKVSSKLGAMVGKNSPSVGWKENNSSVGYNVGKEECLEVVSIVGDHVGVSALGSMVGIKVSC